MEKKSADFTISQDAVNRYGPAVAAALGGATLGGALGNWRDAAGLGLLSGGLGLAYGLTPGEGFNDKWNFWKGYINALRNGGVRGMAEHWANQNPDVVASMATDYVKKNPDKVKSMIYNQVTQNPQQAREMLTPWVKEMRGKFVASLPTPVGRVGANRVIPSEEKLTDMLLAQLKSNLKPAGQPAKATNAAQPAKAPNAAQVAKATNAVQGAGKPVGAPASPSSIHTAPAPQKAPVQAPVAVSEAHALQAQPSPAVKTGPNRMTNAYEELRKAQNNRAQLPSVMMPYIPGR